MTFKNTEALVNKKMEVVDLLAPCPFCGSHDIEAFAQYEDDCPERSAIARCHSCDAQSAQMVGRNKIEMAIAAWNCRVTPPSVIEGSPLAHCEFLPLLVAELCRATSKHPNWPTDAIHASAILHEEAGELTQATIDFHFYHGDRERMREEVIQVGAMALRFLMNLESYESKGAL